MKVKFKERVI